MAPRRSQANKQEEADLLAVPDGRHRHPFEGWSKDCEPG